MYKDPLDPGAPATTPQGQAPQKVASRPAVAAPTDVTKAKAALDRISIPEDALARISEVVLPGASLIVSDEGMSREIGKDTDFIIVMSNEPQGALKARVREPRPDTYERAERQSVSEATTTGGSPDWARSLFGR
jgi:hypothetical protein